MKFNKACPSKEDQLSYLHIRDQEGIYIPVQNTDCRLIVLRASPGVLRDSVVLYFSKTTGLLEPAYGWEQKLFIRAKGEFIEGTFSCDAD